MISMGSDYSLELELPAEALSEIETKVRQAIRRALRRAVAWLRNESVKRLSKELSIKQVALKDRFRIKTIKTNTSAKLWVGILPLSAVKAGSAKQQKDGVQVRDNFYQGAFVKKIHGEYAVWKRKGTEKYPVEKKTIDFSDDAVLTIKQLETQLNRKFSAWMSEAMA